MNETESPSWYELNKDRAKASSKAWQVTHPERVRELKRKWAKLRRVKKARKRAIKPHPDLSPEEYHELLTKQGGKCGICDKLPTPKGKFEADREYLTGNLRGLLCKDCFLGLACFRTQKLVEFAIKYMREN